MTLGSTHNVYRIKFSEDELQLINVCFRDGKAGYLTGREWVETYS